MPSILLKDVSPVLHKQLKKRAEQNRRSMAQEAVFMLERMLLGPRPEMPPLLKPLKPISRQDVLRAIKAGRR
jgi:hypothetical protein